MSNFEAFMIENNEKEIEFVVSNRFKGADGKPVPFKLKPINSKENNDIRKACYKKIPVPGKRGQYTNDFDTPKYLMELALACVTYPNLNDEQLQNHYHVMGAGELLGVMLTPGEFDDLTEKLQEINGYNIEEKVEEAKN